LLLAGLGGERQADEYSQITGELPIMEETVVETIYQLYAG
jgi:hypothetical protein